MARFELEVHAFIGPRVAVDRWYTSENYSTSRGTDGHSAVLTLDAGADEQDRVVKSISYGRCDRIVVRELSDPDLE